MGGNPNFLNFVSKADGQFEKHENRAFAVRNQSQVLKMTQNTIILEGPCSAQRYQNKVDRKLKRWDFFFFFFTPNFRFGDDSNPVFHYLVRFIFCSLVTLSERFFSTTFVDLRSTAELSVSFVLPAVGVFTESPGQQRSGVQDSARDEHGEPKTGI